MREYRLVDNRSTATPLLVPKPGGKLIHLFISFLAKVIILLYISENASVVIYIFPLSLRSPCHGTRWKEFKLANRRCKDYKGTRFYNHRTRHMIISSSELQP